MADFEMEFEITGLKVKIKSDRGEAPQALHAVQQQIGNLLQAAAGVGVAEKRQPTVTNSTGVLDGQRVIDAPKNDSSAASRTKNNKRKRGNSGGGTAFDFSHNPETHGSPKQSWNTAQKSMWLLYTLEKQTGVKEHSTPTIAATFNKYFKEFGPVTTTNVTRDLGSARAKHNFVTSDASKDPQTWYLLDTGKKEVERLIQSSHAESGASK